MTLVEFVAANLGGLFRRVGDRVFVLKDGEVRELNGPTEMLVGLDCTCGERMCIHVRMYRYGLGLDAKWPDRKLCKRKVRPYGPQE